MQRLARWIVRWTVIIAVYYIVGISTSSLALLLWARLGFGAKYSLVVWCYTFMLLGVFGAVGASMLVDQWQKHSPIITAQHLTDGWNWWKQLLRDPLRRERLLYWLSTRD